MVKMRQAIVQIKKDDGSCFNYEPCKVFFHEWGTNQFPRSDYNQPCAIVETENGKILKIASSAIQFLNTQEWVNTSDE